MAGDKINQLPDECIAYIFGFLPDARDRCHCSAVSKRWLNVLAVMKSNQFRNSGNDPSSSVINISRRLLGKTDIGLAAAIVGIRPHGRLNGLALCAPAAHPPGFTNHGLSILSQSSQTLRKLALWNCPQVTDEGLESIASGCPALGRLEIKNCPLVGDRGLKAVADHCKELSILILDSCSSVGNRSMAAFANQAATSKLKCVMLVGCPLIGDIGITMLVFYLQKLAILRLASMNLGDTVLKAIGQRGSQLRVLFLESIQGPSEREYAWICLVKQLESLSLSACSGLTDRSFGDGSTNNLFAGLKKVSIKDCSSLTDAGLTELTASAGVLESLTVINCSTLRYAGIMQALTKSLKVLRLVKCNLIAAGSERGAITSCATDYCHSNLERLALKECNGLEDWFLSWMGGTCCKKVKHIELVGMGGAVTDCGLFGLLRPLHEGNKKLESLDLSGCTGIGDWSLAGIMSTCGDTLTSLKLAGCSGLSDRTLEMIGKMCKYLGELDLSRSQITDDGLLVFMMSVPMELRVLSLEGCEEITDDGLEHIENTYTRLEMLNLSGCPRLTQHGISSIKNFLFRVHIVA